MNSRLLVSVAKGNLHQRQNGVVALLRALECQQVIIRAARAGREFTTDGWTAIVNRAATRRRIKKLTSLAKNRVGLPSQNLLALPGGCKAALRSFEVDIEVIGQPSNIALGHLHALVNRAAVRRTFRTVIVTQCWGLTSCPGSFFIYYSPVIDLCAANYLRLDF